MAALGSFGLDENARSLLEQGIEAVRELTEELRKYNATFEVVELAEAKTAYVETHEPKEAHER